MTFPRGWVLQDSANGAGAAQITRTPADNVTQVLDSIQAKLVDANTNPLWALESQATTVGAQATVTRIAPAGGMVLDSVDATLIVTSGTTGILASVSIAVNGSFIMSPWLYTTAPGVAERALSGLGIGAAAGDTLTVQFTGAATSGQVQDLIVQGHDLTAAPFSSQLGILAGGLTVAEPWLAVPSPPNLDTIELTGLDIATSSVLVVQFETAATSGIIEDITIQGHDI